MNWSARITEKSELSAENTMEYKFVIVGDGKDYVTKSVTGAPDAIQQLISASVTEYGSAWELSQTLPQVGDVLTVVVDE